MGHTELRIRILYLIVHGIHSLFSVAIIVDNGDLFISRGGMSIGNGLVGESLIFLIAHSFVRRIDLGDCADFGT